MSLDDSIRIRIRPDIKILIEYLRINLSATFRKFLYEELKINAERGTLKIPLEKIELCRNNLKKEIESLDCERLEITNDLQILDRLLLDVPRVVQKEAQNGEVNVPRVGQNNENREWDYVTILDKWCEVISKNGLNGKVKVLVTTAEESEENSEEYDSLISEAIDIVLPLYPDCPVDKETILIQGWIPAAVHRLEREDHEISL